MREERDKGFTLQKGQATSAATADLAVGCRTPMPLSPAPEFVFFRPLESMFLK